MNKYLIAEFLDDQVASLKNIIDIIDENLDFQERDHVYLKWFNGDTTYITCDRQKKRNEQVEVSNLFQLLTFDDEQISEEELVSRHEAADEWEEERQKICNQKLDEIFKIESEERKTMVYSFIKGACQIFFHEKIGKLNQQLQEVIQNIKSAHQKRKESHLMSKTVIAATTNGMANHIHILGKSKPSVLFVEEAGQVLETNLIACLLPTLQQIIFIGDHKQLRPQIESYELSLENKSNRHALDLSCFERLIKTSANGVLPLSVLSHQHRQHPFLADLIRPAIYENLKDAKNLSERRSVVPGFSTNCNRLFWWDHNTYEDAQTSDSASRSNKYEVNRAIALANYLLKQDSETK
eukprot:Awhi_evm1s2821